MFKFTKSCKWFSKVFEKYGISAYFTFLLTFNIVWKFNTCCSSGYKIAVDSNDGVLFCTSLMTNNIEKFLVCILDICILSFLWCLFNIFACSCVLNCVIGVLYIFWVQVTCQICVLWILFPQWCLYCAFAINNSEFDDQKFSLIIKYKNCKCFL